MKTILTVEDEVGLWLALEALLSNLGRVLVAKTKEEALSIVKARAEQSEPIDAAVVDLRLVSRRGIDPDAGFAVVEQLERSFSKTPIVVMTVRNDKEAWKRSCDSSNVNCYVTKPFASDDLTQAVKYCLKNGIKPKDSEPILFGQLEVK